MLTIENRENLKGEELNKGMITYYVEGVYEYPNTYNIHVRSYDKGIVDEMILLLRAPMYFENKGYLYNHYVLYNSNEPHKRTEITSQSIKEKKWFIEAIEYILNK